MSAQGGASRKVLWFLLLTVVLDTMGLGLLIPVTPRLILQLSGAGVARAAIYGGWLTACFATMQFFAGPVLGAVSDRVGRRPVLLVSLGAFGLSYLLMAFAPNLAWLFVAQLLTGLFGATPATAGAFVADITSPVERTRHFGTLAAAFGTGFVIGPALGGLLVGFGLRVPFLVSAALSLLTVSYGLLVLPESLPRERRRPFSWRRANPLGAATELIRRAHVALLLLAVLFQRIATSALPAVWPYFTMQQYGWGAREIGYSLAAYGVVTVLSQAGLLRWLDRHIGSRRAAELGLTLMAIGYLGFALGHGAWVVPVCIPLTTLGFMAGPALSSLLSVRVPADAQGSLQGVIASLSGVAAVLTPLVMPLLFSVFSKGVHGFVFPGTPYVLSAGIALIGALLILRGATPADSRGPHD